jgi:hypothetical protein
MLLYDFLSNMSKSVKMKEINSEAPKLPAKTSDDLNHHPIQYSLYATSVFGLRPTLIRLDYLMRINARYAEPTIIITNCLVFLLCQTNHSFLVMMLKED